MTNESVKRPRTAITTPADAADSLPTAADFFLDTPLYKFFRFGPGDHMRMLEMLHRPLTIDVHCPECDKPGVFQRPLQPQPHTLPHERGYDVVFFCARSHEHTLWFRLQVRSFMHSVGDSGSTRIMEIGKIGQWPTFADLKAGAMGRHRRVLGDRASELTRAFYLVAHSIGVGAFVYLRHVFESLIQDAHAQALTDHADFPESDYQRAHMDQRIKLLKDYLPEFLVQHRAIYSILSKGIHELSEQECLLHFDTVREGIEMILDERAHELRRAERLKTAGDAISRLQGKLSK